MSFFLNFTFKGVTALKMVGFVHSLGAVMIWGPHMAHEAMP
jgi:hypothetical protein